MLSSGTVVPGTVMSTVQEAQAADEVSFTSAQEALNYLKEAFNDKDQPAVFVLDDETYQPDVKSELKDAVDSVEKAGYTVKFEGVADDTHTNIHTGTTVTVTKDSDSAKETFKLPVEIYGAKRIAEEYLDSTDDKIDLSDIEITEETSKATVKKLVEKKITGELDGFAKKDKVTVEVTVNDPSTKDDVKSFEVSVKITAGTTPCTVTGTVSTETEHVATASEKAADIVKKSALVAVVKDSVSIGASSTVSTDITNAVCEAAKAAIKADEQFADNDTITVEKKDGTDSMIGYGAWHGVLKINVDNGEAVEVELNAKVMHESEAEEKTVINLELVGAPDEIEVGTDFTTAVPKMKIYFEDGTSTELESSNFAGSDNTYFTYNKNAFSSAKLGTTSVEFKSLNSVNPVTVTYTANIVKTEDYDNQISTDNSNAAVKETEISALTSSDEKIIKIVSDEDKAEWSFKAVGAGKATVTVVAKDGKTYTSEVTVSEDGTMTFATAKYLKTESYITSDSYGLIADKVTSQSQTPDNWKDDVVAKTEVVDLNGTNAVKITPVANGEATFKVSGGDNGKLENTITVNVADTGITVQEGTKNFDTLVLNQKTQDALLSRAYSESDLNGKEEIALDVADFDFPSDAKLVLKKSTKEVDTVSADEITGITLKNDSGKLNLVVEYCGTSTTINNVAAVVNATSVENTVATLGLVADSIKSVEKPDHNEYIQAELTKNASGQSIVYITPGEDLTDKTTATVKVVVEDSEGNTADITVKIAKGEITAATPTKFSGYTGYAVDTTEAGKIVYTLGDTISYKGIYLVKDGEEKVPVTEKMVTDYTTSTTETGTGALAEETATVTYGGFSGTFTYYVKPALATVDVDSLGLADGEKVTNVTWKGDSTINASLTDEKTAIEIMATKTEQSGSVLVTTNKGNTVNVKVSVDANGKIVTSTNNYFESSMTVVDNTIENLGVVGTSAASSNTDVAIVKLAGNRVVITSVGIGTAEITVSDGNSSAIIPVTVDEFGTITIGDIQTAVEDGFVRGEGSDWYYYINGKKVTNDWVAVEEADPYNNNEVGKVWYHFDKDGKMQRGWIKDESGWKIYNLDSNGRMRHDMWINAEANEELGMPTGIYHLLSDGAAQMNGWAESITEGIYWFCAPNSGVFDASNPANWATSMPE